MEIGNQLGNKINDERELMTPENSGMSLRIKRRFDRYLNIIEIFNIQY